MLVLVMDDNTLSSRPIGSCRIYIFVRIVQIIQSTKVYVGKGCCIVASRGNHAFHCHVSQLNKKSRSLGYHHHLITTPDFA